MENKKEKLFLLIKSLTGNEKGYFKKYASFHTIGKVNNYVLLFDVIAGQAAYDEQKTKSLVKKKIHPRNFREAKNYLYEMILKSLDLYHSGSSATFLLRRLLTSIDILFTKTLYHQCKDLLDKAEKIATDHENFNILTEIYERRLKIIVMAESFKGTEEKDLYALQEKENASLEKMRKLAKYRFLNASLFYNLRKNRVVREKKELTTIYRHIMEDPLLKNDNWADSREAKLFLYSTLGAWHFIVRDRERSLECYHKYLKIFEERPRLVNEKFDRYLTGIYNLTVAYMRLNDYDRAMKIIDKLYPVKTDTQQQEITRFVFYYSRKLEIFLNTAQPGKALAIIPAIEEGIKKYNNKLNAAHIFTFYYNIAYIYYMYGDHKKAIPWLSKIITHSNVNVSNDVQSYARILNLVIHFELKNAEHLSYAIRSASRFIRRKGRLFEFEKALIRHIRGLANTPNETELKKRLLEFKKELTALGSDPYEKRAIDYFDFFSWIESRIKNKPFIDVMRRNYLKSKAT